MGISTNSVILPNGRAGMPISDAWSAALWGRGCRLKPALQAVSVVTGGGDVAAWRSRAAGAGLGAGGPGA